MANGADPTLMDAVSEEVEWPSEGAASLFLDLTMLRQKSVPA